MKIFKGTPGKWKIGIPGAVVSDTPNPKMSKKRTGHSDTEYYGGYLIAESILTKEDAQLISKSKEMVNALIELVEKTGTWMRRLGYGQQDIDGYLYQYRELIKEATEI